MTNLTKSLIGILAVSALSLSAMAAKAQDSITIAEWGGASQAADRAAFFEPFTKATGIAVVDDVWQGDMATIATQVSTNSYKWSLVRGESALIKRGCDDGILERLDPALVGTADQYLPGGWNECAVAYSTFSTNIAYNADKLKGGAKPESIADFFDLGKFPGKRAVRRHQTYFLELALLADGVKPADLYKVLRTPEGLDRVFKKWDSIKDQIVWWESGSQPAQLLADGEVVMSTAWGNRIVAAQKEGKNLQIVWDGAGLDYDWFMMPKGSPDKEKSTKFLEYILKPENAAKISSVAPFGPVLKKAIPLLKSDDIADLPTNPANAKNAFAFDANYYTENDAELAIRLANWLQK
ncbi:ABC transporter substrate-binding protein [Aminobacter ciceronei]|uniref:Spermidine/putrescine transport system substrate-binding protein n=1 Tax=Aminobacter ciceronei TaxID=150723 RepID=A0ABR6CH38_9HYPH|nr:ABC transporter substrate-binding protein [Aminobacter ciceronei]MBA8910549.1 putative spermidine/putrescine transport system substrate-binding protein [Aminobacter ciceronei]MBA9024320.1 putative spermidine/putrescine transport system substrate-binding protein [Aminobacter ciceronei]